MSTTTENTYVGNGTTVLYSFTYPYIEEDDIYITLDGILTTEYTLANATTIEFNTAPATGVAIRIYRLTDIDEVTAEFFPGSAIRAQDLNANFEQTLYVAQELQGNSFRPDGSLPMTGNLDLGGYDVVNGGAQFNKTVDLANNRITGVAAPINSTDAANRAYVDNRTGGNTEIVSTSYVYYTATQGDTVLTSNTGGVPVFAVSEGLEQIYVNGALQQTNVDYVTDSSSQITFTQALLQDDVVAIHCINNIPVGTELTAPYTYPGGVQQTAQARLEQYVSVKDFGAKGDGVTDDTAAIQAAIALGGDVYFPSGTFLLENATNLILKPNTHLVGAGQGTTILKSTASDIGTKSIWTTNNNTSFKDLTLFHSGPVSGTGLMVTVKGDGVSFLNCEVKSDGSIAKDIITQAFSFSHNESTSNVLIDNCDIHNVNRVFFKANTTTCTLDKLTVTNCYIHDLGMGGCQFNFPFGSASNIVVSNNHFNDFYAGTEQIFVGGASVKNLTVSNNTFSGNAKECVHIEEDAQNINISDNIFSIKSIASLPMRGVWLSGNNTSGVQAEPSNVIINGNLFTNPDLNALHTGIEIKVDDDRNIATDLIVSSNIFEGYEYGIECSGFNPHIVNNLIKSCSKGIRLNSCSPNVESNCFLSCTTAVVMDRYEGLISNNTFLSCAATAVTSASDSTVASMTGFVINLSAGEGGITTDGILVPANAITTIDLPISIGSRMYGSAKLNVQFDNSLLFRNRISELHYDGSTVTDTEKMMYGSGVIAVRGFEENNGKLAVSLNNTGGQDRYVKALIVQFDGLWISPPTP